MRLIYLKWRHQETKQYAKCFMNALFNIKRTQQCVHCYPQFADDKIEAQRGEGTCPRTNSMLLVALGLLLGSQGLPSLIVWFSVLSFCRWKGGFCPLNPIKNLCQSQGMEIKPRRSPVYSKMWTAVLISAVESHYGMSVLFSAFQFSWRLKGREPGTH